VFQAVAEVALCMMLMLARRVDEARAAFQVCRKKAIIIRLSSAVEFYPTRVGRAAQGKRNCIE
jgi:phosphoglycerate dehydrogenase-like enzyme